jgi:hypothetical protein
LTSDGRRPTCPYLSPTPESARDDRRKLLQLIRGDRVMLEGTIPVGQHTIEDPDRSNTFTTGIALVVLTVAELTSPNSSTVC